MENSAKKIDSFSVIRKLGQGGMADVYLAHSDDGEEVAIKVIKSEFTASPRYVKRFHRECMAVSGLRHPHIIQLKGYGTHQGHPYAVMEYLPGKSLQDKLDEEAKLPENEVQFLLSPLLEAISYYGAKGLVHRDLKPSNILFRDDGSPVIVDFGLVYDAELTKMTQAGQVVGTPAYIAPEILRGESADIKSDLYQLGVILFECLTGELPFKAPTPALVMTYVLQGRAESLKDAAPELDDGLVTFVNNLMASNKDERYQSADAALADLALLESGKKLASKEKPLAPPAVASTTPVTKGSPRFFISLTLTLFLFLLAAWIYGSNSSNGYNAPVPRPRVTAGFGKVRVDWVSKVPLRTRAILYDDDDKEILSRSDGEQSQNHSFVLPIENKSSNYRLRLKVLPNGPVSLPLSLKTQQMPEFDVKNVQFDDGGLTVTLLSKKSLPEAEYSLVVKDRRGRVSTSLFKRNDRYLLAKSGETGADIAHLSCKINCPSTREEEMIDLDGPFKTWTESYYDKCKDLSFTEIMASMLTKAVAELVNNSGRDLKAVTSEGVIEKKGWQKLNPEQKETLQKRLDGIQSWSRNQKWGSLILDVARHQDVLLSSPLIPLKQQCVIYQSAQGAVGIDAGFLARNWPSFTDRHYSFGHTWSYSWRWSPPSGGGWFTQFESTLPSDEIKMKAVDLALLVIGKKKEARHFRFTLSPDELQKIKRCCLCLEIRQLPNRLYLDAHVNGFPRFLITSMKQGEGSWFCQNFPVELLKTGPNKIEVTVNLVSAFFREKSHVVLKSVALLVER